MPDEPATVEAMADDAAAVLRALEIPSAHVAGFSGGSIIAQELALGHPELVRSLVLAEQLAGDGLLPPLVAVVRSLAGRGSPERACLPRGVLPGHLHGAGAQRGNGRPDHRGGARFSPQAVDRGPAGLPRRFPSRSRHDRPVAGDRRADARDRGRPRPDQSAGTVPRRRRPDPGRPVRGDGGGGPPALPGGAGRMERPRRRLLARGRGRG